MGKKIVNIYFVSAGKHTQHFFNSIKILDYSQ